MSRENLIIKGLKFGFALKSFCKKENLSKQEKKILNFLFGESNFIRVHNEFFIPFLEIFASPDQQEKWLSKCQNLEIIGSYAFSELGHGSSTSKIETEAIYDSSTKEFIINSPSNSSIK